MNENGNTLSVNVSSFVPLSMMGYFKGPVGCVDSLLCLRMSAVEVKQLAGLLDEWRAYIMLMSLHRHCAVNLIGYFEVDGLSLQQRRAIHKTRFSMFSSPITLPKRVCEWICRLSTKLNARINNAHNFRTVIVNLFLVTKLNWLSHWLYLSYKTLELLNCYSNDNYQ